jgi:DNA polymerase-3 subunit alpha (Gram-positive type)
VSGIGEAAAISLVDAYNEKPFSSIDDISKRTKLSQTNIEDLKKHGLFEELPESAQVNLFDLFSTL